MKREQFQEVGSEVVEEKGPRTGKCRLKPRQLSPILRQVIVDQFLACHSSEDVAESLRIPARTVTDVVIATLFRKPPQPALSAFAGLRKTA